MRLRTVLAGALLAAAAAGAATQSPPLDEARQAARAHRYPRVLRLLEPFLDRRDLAPETRFGLLTEVGRARFHLGRYPGAYEAFCEAVRIQPRSPEAAIYFEASAWLTGHRAEALQVFEALLQSGARDLYLPVTLPGERSFLSDPEVWTVLGRHERPLAVDLRHGVALGAPLGSPRDSVLAVLPGAPPENGTELILRAGPKVLWVLHFDHADTLAEVLLDAENLLRYTPYRLTFACGLDWRMTPEAARRLLGTPAEEAEAEGAGRVLVWRFGTTRASLEFGPPREPRPPVIPAGSPVLRLLRLVKVGPAS